jgi:aminopeptidase N
MFRLLGVLFLVCLTSTAPFAAASDQPDLEHRLQRYNGDGPANALLEHRHHGGHHKAASDSWAPDLGPSPIDVQRYDLSLFLDFDRQVASGSIEVQLSAAVPDLQVVEFDASQILRILGVVLLAEDGLPYDTPLPLTHRHRNDRLSVDLPRPLVEGAGIRLMITYTGRASEQGQGINWHTHGGGARVAWTMAEPFGARLWWPCNDRPDDKAVVTLQVTAPDQYVTASNGLEVSRIAHGDGTATSRWESEYPVAPYLVVLNVSDFVYSETTYIAADGTTMPVVLYAYPEVADQAEQDLAFTPEVMGVLAELFGEYPFVDEKYGNVTANFGGGMEHQTLTTLGYTAVGSAWMEYLNTHELAHQWWGDWVTCADWRELWLNEGFATITEWLWAEHKGEAVLQDYLVGTDSLGFFFGPVYDNPVPFSGTVYDKGGWVLRMMRHIMGDDDFFAAVRAYGEQRAHQAATSWDLLAAFENQTGEDYDWFFDQWVFGENRPRMTASWSATSETSLDLVFDQVQTNAPPFRLPLDVRVTTGVGIEDHRIWLDGDTEVTLTTAAMATDVAFDPDNWVLADIVPASAPLADLGPGFPGPFDAGLARLGASAPITIPVTNVGGGTMTITAAGMYYGSGDFLLEAPGAFPVVLEPGESVDFEITYEGGGMGEDADWLWIQTDVPLHDGVLLAQVSGSSAVFEGPYLLVSSRVSLGSVPIGGVGQAVLEVTNMGDQPMSVDATMAGEAFVLASEPHTQIPPGSRADLRLLFTPESVGGYEGTLILNTTDPANAMREIDLTGTGTDAPRVTVDPPVLDFGVSDVGAEQTVLVGNVGTADLSLIDLVIGEGFTADATLPAVVAPGETVPVTVRSDLTKAAPTASHTVLRMLTTDAASPWVTVPVLAVRPPTDSAMAPQQYIAAAAAAPGLGGARWSTDVTLTNSGDHPQAVSLNLLEDGHPTVSERTVTVPARGQRRLKDVVTSLGRSGVGGLGIQSSSNDVTATSRTFASASGATYGQSLPALATGQLQTANTTWLLPGLRSGNGFHTNFGLLNPGNVTATVQFEVHDPTGASLGTVILAAEPGAFVQAVEAIARVTPDPVTGGFAVATVSPADATVSFYGSVVDDGSHDPTTIMPLSREGAGGSLMAPSVASIAGFGTTRWASSVDLVNLGTTAAEAVLSLHLPSEVLTATISVPGGAVWRSEDVVTEVFATEGTGWLSVDAGSSVLVGASRTYTTGPEGTFGQSVPILAATATHSCQAPVLIPGLTRADGFRTNLGFTNPGVEPLLLQVTLLDDAGREMDRFDVTVPADAFVQRTRVLQGGGTEAGWAIVRCDGGDAAFVAQASIIDGLTGDPTWVDGISF